MANKKSKLLEQHVAKMQESLKDKNMVISDVERERDFLIQRIKQVHGHEGYYKIMNHLDAPNGFNAVEYKKKYLKGVSYEN